MAVMDFGHSNAGSFAAALFSPVKALLDWFAGYRNAKRVTEQLSRLSDRSLDDLGLARSDIPRIARQSRKRHTL